MIKVQDNRGERMTVAKLIYKRLLPKTALPEYMTYSIKTEYILVEIFSTGVITIYPYEGNPLDYFSKMWG